MEILLPSHPGILDFHYTTIHLIFSDKKKTVWFIAFIVVKKYFIIGQIGFALVSMSWFLISKLTKIAATQKNLKKSN